MAKMGRPRLEIPRNERLHLRLTEQEYMDIKAYATEHNLTITQTIVRAFYSFNKQEQTSDDK